jgi:hypothetical protein
MTFAASLWGGRAAGGAFAAKTEHGQRRPLHSKRKKHVKERGLFDFDFTKTNFYGAK